MLKRVLELQHSRGLLVKEKSGEEMIGGGKDSEEGRGVNGGLDVEEAERKRRQTEFLDGFGDEGEMDICHSRAVFEASEVGPC